MQLVSGVLVLVLVVFTMAQKPHYDLNQAEELFEKYIKDYNKHYKNKLDKEAHYNAFVASLVSINKLNRDPRPWTATFDINKFSDYTPEEQHMLHGFVPPTKYLT